MEALRLCEDDYMETLKGSMEFRGTTYETNDSPSGTVSNEPVYLVYFKRGSLVALSSSGGNGDPMDEWDIVWAPGGEQGVDAPSTKRSNTPRPPLHVFWRAWCLLRLDKVNTWSTLNTAIHAGVYTCLCDDEYSGKGG